MLERLQRIATTLSRFRLLILTLGIVSAGVFAVSLFPNPWLDGEAWLIPSLVALSWFLIMHSLNSLFLHIPPKAEKGDSWRNCMSTSIRRGALWLFGLAFVSLTLAVLVLTYQLLRTWYIA